jgi:hypothetical protein
MALKRINKVLRHHRARLPLLQASLTDLTPGTHRSRPVRPPDMNDTLANGNTVLTYSQRPALVVQRWPDR